MNRLLSISAFALLGLVACGEVQEPVSVTGVHKATAEVRVQANGLTVEQENISKRLKTDNTPGSLKHLYVISAYSGDVLLYSTVIGKVTSSGKRLSPYQVASVPDTSNRCQSGFDVNVGDKFSCTQEVLQDDGTYGSSVEYIYWWDSKGVYHQHYVSGGQIVHVSDQPMRVGRVIISAEVSPTKDK